MATRRYKYRQIWNDRKSSQERCNPHDKKPVLYTGKRLHDILSLIIHLYLAMGHSEKYHNGSEILKWGVCANIQPYKASYILYMFKGNSQQWLVVPASGKVSTIVVHWDIKPAACGTKPSQQFLFSTSTPTWDSCFHGTGRSCARNYDFTLKKDALVLG